MQAGLFLKCISQAIFTKYVVSCRYLSYCCLQLHTRISFLDAKTVCVCTLLKIAKRPLCPLHSDVDFPDSYMLLLSFINYGQYVRLQ